MPPREPDNEDASQPRTGTVSLAEGSASAKVLSQRGALT